ncbi:DNA-methyltransferase [Embleya sp. NPDC020630]|uniref:DNA-methyltransferase n=1 Tax=Embleya sp. NPDC020630 TaxID=3363979 RepID=UPI0037A9649D
MPDPYYADEQVSLYHGDMREILPELALQADLIVTDPPYGDTSHTWDRWPDHWPTIAAQATSSMWCFGSMRMYLDRAREFGAWKLSQDVIWEKHNASGPDADRFRRIHEHALHWYRGPWRDTHHDPQRITTGVIERGRIINNGAKAIGQRGTYSSNGWTDNGTRLAASVIRARSMHRNGGIHPTEKPVGILDPLIRYGCPTGGLVLDPFAGSGSTLDASRQAGRRAIGIEADERYCEAAARRLSALTLPA